MPRVTCKKNHRLSRRYAPRLQGKPSSRVSIRIKPYGSKLRNARIGRYTDQPVNMVWARFCFNDLHLLHIAQLPEDFPCAALYLPICFLPPVLRRKYDVIFYYSILCVINFDCHLSRMTKLLCIVAVARPASLSQRRFPVSEVLHPQQLCRRLFLAKAHSL